MDNDEELEQLVVRVIDLFGEPALGVALMRALENLPQCPLDAWLWRLVPSADRGPAIAVDPEVLKERLTEQLRRLARLH